MSTCAGCNAPLPPTRPGADRPRKWCSDRCRKVTLYSRQCVDCGAMCAVDGRVTNPALRCEPCAHAEQYRKTEAWIVASYRDWEHRYGDAPNSVDWNLALARSRNVARLPVLKARHAERRWPPTSSVINHFGSWRAFVELMGGRVQKAGRKKAVAA